MTYSIVSERKAKEAIQVRSPQDAYDALARYKNLRREHFLTLLLDGSHTITRILITTIGLVNRSLVHPREVFAPAIVDRACGIMVGAAEIPSV